MHKEAMMLSAKRSSADRYAVAVLKGVIVIGRLPRTILRQGSGSIPLELVMKRHTATKCCHTKTKVKGHVRLNPTHVRLNPTHVRLNPMHVHIRGKS